jgi:hypothetical protein
MEGREDVSPGKGKAKQRQYDRIQVWLEENNLITSIIIISSITKMDPPYHKPITRHIQKLESCHPAPA